MSDPLGLPATRRVQWPKPTRSSMSDPAEGEVLKRAGHPGGSAPAFSPSRYLCGTTNRAFGPGLHGLLMSLATTTKLLCFVCACCLFHDFFQWRRLRNCFRHSYYLPLHQTCGGVVFLPNPNNFTTIFSHTNLVFTSEIIKIARMCFQTNDVPRYFLISGAFNP